MTKSAKLREAMQAVPGATLDELQAATKLDRNFISTVCGQWVRKGRAKGSASEGYTLLDDLPPRLAGNRAALRAARRKGKGPKTRRVRAVIATAAEARGSGYRWLRESLTPEQFAGFLRGNALMALSMPDSVSWCAAVNYVTGLIEAVEALEVRRG